MSLRSMIINQVDIGLLQDEIQIGYAIKNLSKPFSSLKDAQLALRKLKIHEKRYKVEYDDIKTLLVEVIDDMKWLNCKSNNIILWVDKNAKRVEGYVAKKFCVNNIMIRAHTKKKHLLVIGNIVEERIVDVKNYVSRISGFKAVVFTMKSS